MLPDGRGAVVTVVLGEIGWQGQLPMWSAQWRMPSRGWAEEVLSAVALVRENYGGAAEDHCSYGDVQQETEGGEKQQQAHCSYG